jgi:hypothetical protein
MCWLFATIQTVTATRRFKKNKVVYQQIGLKFEEETSEMLHLERGFVWC